jgi:thiol-disulfide isomerase/thioredoxin
MSSAARNSTTVMRINRPSQIRALEKLIEKGPATLVLIWSPTCPHCHTYMPLWDSLAKTNGRAVNMVSVKSDVYQETPLSEKQNVTSVPTVLYVDKEGRATEVEDTRNTTTMTNIVTTAKPEAEAASAPSPSPVPSPSPAPSPSETATNSNTLSSLSSMYSLPAQNKPSPPAIVPAIPGTQVSPNPLSPLPAMVQRGGNPLAAFLLAAKEVAPAAALLGAYAATIPQRSSGLRAARRSRRHRRNERRRRVTYKK